MSRARAVVITSAQGFRRGNPADRRVPISRGSLVTSIMALRPMGVATPATMLARKSSRIGGTPIALITMAARVDVVITP